MLKLFTAAFGTAMALGTVTTAIPASEAARPALQQNAGWKLPPDAPGTKNPFTVDETLLATGSQVFSDKCRKCHGPKGLGDGPDADPERAEEMNLTNPVRAARNPDGVVFYKVLNGRSKPKMPTFKDELSQDQIWAVVAYVQSLRTK